jgi:hypothetical protein
VARRTTRWRARQGRIEAQGLVFIDETWIKTNMGPHVIDPFLADLGGEHRAELPLVAHIRRLTRCLVEDKIQPAFTSQTLRRSG